MGVIVEAGLHRPKAELPPPGGAKWTKERVLSIRRWTPTLLSIRLTRYKGFRSVGVGGLRRFGHGGAQRP